MKISPRYGTDPAVRLEVAPDAVRAPLMRQRQRLAGLLARLDESHWSAASRCEDWSVQDVVAHLINTDQFWAYSIACGLAGEPSRVLADFDPQASPASLVASVRGTVPEETLRGFVEASEGLCSAVDNLSDADWSLLAETPVGHVAITAMAHHALWDGWVHERDILEPLGLGPVDEADEIEASLRYAVALSPAFALQTPGCPEGSVAVVATDLDLTITATLRHGHVRVCHTDPPSDALVLAGAAVELLDALSVRAPLTHQIAPEHEWLVSGMRAVFEPDPAR